MPTRKSATRSSVKKTQTEKLTRVQKRDGRIVPFDDSRIVNAIVKAMRATGEGEAKDAEKVSLGVQKELLKVRGTQGKSFVPTVEQIQDIVEQQLIFHQFAQTAKAYIIYRERRAELRRERGGVPGDLRALADESSKYFKNQYGEFVYYRTYSRWIEESGRRETWIETVNRYVDFMKENLGDKLKPAEYEEVRQTILKQETMPSMRLLQFSGKPARRCNVCAYNCSYIAPTKLEDFAEIMYVSMCGSGVGWSAESQNIQQLPIIKRQTGKKRPTFVVEDSKEGWGDAMTYGLKTWYNGEDVDFDFSKLRPAGARLKTMGGKSSGPEPLMNLLDFTRERVLRHQGKRLSNISAHDIMCKIGECVVSGGVRRSAMISLSDLDDFAIRDAKKGQFYLTEGQRSLANNSAVYLEKPTAAEFLEEWMALIKSGTGERGIFNRGSLAKQLPSRRVKALRGYISNGVVTGMIGVNPCGEIILRSKQFCNLTEVVARPDDTEASLTRKIRVAAILGTYQASLTDFKYLSKDWKKNCEEEALLGVGITGQWDCPVVRKPEVLSRLRDEAIKVNQEYAKRFGIKPSTSVTCVKPSGNISQTVDCASGMHPRHSPYYIRRVRISATDGLFKMLKDQGVKYHPEVGQTMDNAHTFVLEFPIKSPKSDHYRDDLTALDQLEYWKMVKTNYTEHNPSTTISVGEDEWVAVANWLYQNWDLIGGLSFLPRSNHVYKLAPYEEITKERYEQMVKELPDIDFSKIVLYEKQDETAQAKELACAGGVCEIDPLMSEAAIQAKGDSGIQAKAK